MSVNSYGYTIYFAYFIYAVDLVLYMVVALYLDNVMPTPGGIRKPWFYFMTRSYWCPRAPAVESSNEETKESLLESGPGQLLNTNYEPVSSDLRSQDAQGRTVKIRRLKKVFGENPAVDGFSVDMYSGQIFALLGHNGAGKTTTISMLTGMLIPTEGTATAFNIDIFHNLMQLRKDLGVCTQHDSYFEQLTVQEHLTYFGKIRGLSNAQIESESSQLLTDLKLIHEKDTLLKKLSGGNKRKLSVALAFLGGPRFVLLDEPTSGMDATTRRELWDVLANYKRDRIIVLTTHYMDEADALGDRIGIMAKGKLICCGSSMFLKKKYGIGYNLAIIMQNPEISTEQIKRFVFDNIENAETGLIAGEEIEFRLPFSESPKFKGMFEEMDNRMEELGIKSYGISVTTLEDVFIRVGENAVETDHEWQEEKIPMQIDAKRIYSLAEEAEVHKLHQFSAVLKKKLKETVRNLSVFLCSVIFPLVLIWFAIFGISAIMSTSEHQYSLLKDYGRTPVFVNKKDVAVAAAEPDYIKWLESFQETSGFSLMPVDVPKGEKTLDRVVDFAKKINETKNSAPLAYGSYYIHTFDTVNNKYGAILLFNVVVPQSLLAFGGEFINMLAKNAKSDKSVEVRTTIVQMEISDLVTEIIGALSTVGQFTSFFSLGFAVLAGLVASYLVREYENELKAHLKLAGLPLGVYWLSYFLVDLLNLYLPVVGVIVIYKVAGTAVGFCLPVAAVVLGLPPAVPPWPTALHLCDQPYVLEGVFSVPDKHSIPRGGGNADAKPALHTAPHKSHGDCGLRANACDVPDSHLLLHMGLLLHRQQRHVSTLLLPPPRQTRIQRL